MAGHGRGAIGVAIVLTIVTSSQGILTAASKVNGKYEYNFSTVPFLAEALKLMVSVYLLLQETARSKKTVQMTKEWSSVILFVVPSLIYLVHNNVSFMVLSYVDPATYQVLGNLKIMTTGVLFWLFLGRRLTTLQWLALQLLLLGATTSQISNECNGAGLLSAPLKGYLWGILSAFLSGFAAVYTEYVMKKNNDSLYWQNCQMYAFGVLFNGLSLTAADVKAAFSNGLWLFRMFNGYNVWTALVVANMAFSGLLVSWIMKYADSIMKVYATSMAMLVTMLISVAAFGTPATLQLYYSRPSDLVVKLPSLPCSDASAGRSP